MNLRSTAWILLKRALIPATRSRSEGSDRTRGTLHLGSNPPAHCPINGWTQRPQANAHAKPDATLFPEENKTKHGGPYPRLTAQIAVAAAVEQWCSATLSTAATYLSLLVQGYRILVWRSRFSLHLLAMAMLSRVSLRARWKELFSVDELARAPGERRLATAAHRDRTMA